MFYFGNAIGESGDDPANGVVDADDELASRTHKTGFSMAAVTNLYDYNRDGKVNATDDLIARNNPSGATPLQLISLPTGSPPAALDALQPVLLLPVAIAIPQPLPLSLPMEIFAVQSAVATTVAEIAVAQPLAVVSTVIASSQPIAVPLSAAEIRPVTAPNPSAVDKVLSDRSLKILPDALERLYVLPVRESPRQPGVTRPLAAEDITPLSARHAISTHGQESEKRILLLDSVFTRLIARRSIREDIISDDPAETVDIETLIGSRQVTHHKNGLLTPLK